MSLVKVVPIDTSISLETRRFLIEAGLPQQWSGPFTFDFEENLNRVSDVYGCYGQGGDWEPDVYKRLNRYIYLGFDGGDNPICLDSHDEEKVVFLDHESFTHVDLSGQFMNSSIAYLAESILSFQEMLERYQQEKGEEADLFSGKMPSDLDEKTLFEVCRIDPAVAAQSGYWPQLFEYI